MSNRLNEKVYANLDFVSKRVVYNI